LRFFDQNNGYNQLDDVLEYNLIIFSEIVEVRREHHFLRLDRVKYFEHLERQVSVMRQSQSHLLSYQLLRDGFKCQLYLVAA